MSYGWNITHPPLLTVRQNNFFCGARMTAARGLVVEDEYLVQLLLAELLAELGYDVVALAANVKKASSTPSKRTSISRFSTSIWAGKRFFQSPTF
jgi:hypothetical protein